jgi:hypothetical protein
MVLLRHDRPREALAVLQSDGVRVPFGIIFHQWVAALAAEAAVLAGHPDSPGLLYRATAVSQGNPIAAAVTRRAAALVGDGAVDIRARLDAVAADLDHAGAHFEAQRARHLAATCAAIPLG